MMRAVLRVQEEKSNAPQGHSSTKQIKSFGITGDWKGDTNNAGLWYETVGNGAETIILNGAGRTKRWPTRARQRRTQKRRR